MKINAIRFAPLAVVAALIPVVAAATPPADAWEIGPWVRGRNYSVGMPPNPTPGPRGSSEMDFPVGPERQVDAMTTAIRPLAGARQIKFRYRIDAAPGTRFVAVESPGEPATVSLYFQRAGDSWSGKGRFASHRWYVPGAAVIPIQPGERTVVVRLDETWTNVQGQPNTMFPGDYEAALMQTARLGIAFGSSGLRSHGVYATGPARFTLLELTIS